jgi:hypothetical protein
MKILIHFKTLILLLYWYPLWVSAQIEPMELEKEIKLSGNYIYSQATSKQENDAKITAKNALLSDKEFSEFLKEKNKEHSEVTIEYLLKPVGPNIRAIAYIKKTEKPITKLTESTNPSSTPIKEETLTKKINLKNLPKTFLSLSNTENCTQTWEELNKLKREGILVFGARSDAFDNLSDCHIIICDQNYIQHFLGPGTDTRYDYVNNKSIEYPKSILLTNKTIIYVFTF